MPYCPDLLQGWRRSRGKARGPPPNEPEGQDEAVDAKFRIGLASRWKMHCLTYLQWPYFGPVKGKAGIWSSRADKPRDTAAARWSAVDHGVEDITLSTPPQMQMQIIQDLTAHSIEQSFADRPSSFAFPAFSFLASIASQELIVSRTLSGPSPSAKSSVRSSLILVVACFPIDKSARRTLKLPTSHHPSVPLGRIRGRSGC